MTIVNLTPHEITVHLGAYGGGPLEIPPSGEVARVATSDRLEPPVDTEGGMIPVVSTTTGEVEGLPAPQDGVVYVVSWMVAAAAPRDDVFSPGPLVRDPEGKVIGCLGLRASCSEDGVLQALRAVRGVVSVDRPHPGSDITVEVSPREITSRAKSAEGAWMGPRQPSILEEIGDVLQEAYYLDEGGSLHQGGPLVEYRFRPRV